MAATHVYATICRIPLSGGDVEDAVYTGASGATGVGFDTAPTSPLEATSATFKLRGGLYSIEVVGSTFGTVTLQKLGPDGSTYLTVLTAISANGYTTAYLSQGTYKLTIA